MMWADIPEVDVQLTLLVLGIQGGGTVTLSPVERRALDALKIAHHSGVPAYRSNTTVTHGRTDGTMHHVLIEHRGADALVQLGLAQCDSRQRVRLTNVGLITQ